MSSYTSVTREKYPWEIIESKVIEYAGKIPKILHQTWKNNTVPEMWAESPKSWIKYHPDWIYVLWTDDDIFEFISVRHKKYLQMFKNFEYSIQKADAIRYFILYDYGGVNTNTFTNFFMVSAKYQQLWLNVINRLENPELPLWAIGQHAKVMYSTGPMMINDMVLNYNKQIGFLPRKLFAPTEINGKFGVKSNPDAVVIMLPGRSWNDKDSNVINFVYQNRILIGVILLILAIIAIIIIIRKFYIRAMKK